MKRVEKSLRNLKFGLAFQLIDTVLKFVLRTVMVHMLGDATVGLNGLFTELIAVLSLTELGVGTAITYNLYKPLAEHDEAHLARLMALFKRAYRIIALAFLAIGLILLPWVHLLVNKVNFELGYIRVVYLLFLLSTASSYLFSYKSAFCSANASGKALCPCTCSACGA